MIARVIEWSLRNRFVVICGVFLLVGWGLHSLYQTPVDAIPDLSENQVIVFADWPGRSPQEVEDQLTYPLSVNLQGLAGIKTVRAASMFGFSLITVIFEEAVDNYFARSRVLERLNYLGDLLPAGVIPKLGPDATGLGWIYQYYLEVDPSQTPGGGYDLAQLRAIQDWFVRYQLNAVPGVAEVGSIGGFVRQYQIEVSSVRMRALQVTLQDVMEAVRQSNLNVGGKVIEENGMEFVLRGRGLIQSAADLEKVVLCQRGGTPVCLRDVATIEVEGDFRRGSLDVNGKEAVGGIVVMRTGENGWAVIRRLKEKIGEITPSLPPGLRIKPFYDRSELIAQTLDTLKRALSEEVLLVILAHIIFLWHFRSILIVTLPLPLSILIAFILMRQFGIKILGDDLEALQQKAFDVERVMQQIPGATGVAASRMQGKPYLEIEVDRVAMARYGLRAQTVLDVVETGLGGKNLTTTIEGRYRYPIQVRLQREEREDIERLGSVLVTSPLAPPIPLSQVATLKRVTGPSEIPSENGRLRVFVQANVQGRDLGGFVKEARERIRREIQLAPGMTIEWSGQYENQVHAQQTLTMIMPAVLLIIFLLLYLVYRSAQEAAHVILAVPFALSGGVFLQYLLGYPFSVAVWVGYIARFGTAIQTGIVMVVYLEEAVARGRAEKGDRFNRADLLHCVKAGARTILSAWGLPHP